MASKATYKKIKSKCISTSFLYVTVKTYIQQLNFLDDQISLFLSLSLSLSLYIYI